MNTQSEPDRRSQTEFDVIISGAGAVGLFLASELALVGCSVLVLEKSANPQSPLKRLPFGIRGLSTPTIEALYRRDLLDELIIHKRLKNPHLNAGNGLRRQVGHFAGIPFHDVDVDRSQWNYRLPGSTQTSLISEIEELETVLARRAASLGAVIRRGFAVTDFSQSEDGVTVQSGVQSFAGKWLIGCDGSRSVVRKKAGFDFIGTEPEFTGYSIQAEITDPEKLKPGRNVTQRGMYLQSQPGYLMIQDFDAGAFHHSKEAITKEHVQEVLRRISDTDVSISAVHVATSWTDRARQAGAYRKGRILLAGDAAHIHSPLGGQGLNLGLGDAMNLGWKLAATVQNRAPAGLLDSYFTERHPVGEQVLNWSRAQVAVMKPEPHAQALHAIFRDLINTRDGATYMAGRVWGVDTRYEAANQHPLVGRSVPHFELEGGAETAVRINDGMGLLLDFGNNSYLKDVVKDFSDSIRYVSVRVKERMGISALLIRPDGFIAWATDSAPDCREFLETAGRWFVRNTGPSAEHQQ